MVPSAQQTPAGSVGYGAEIEPATLEARDRLRHASRDLGAVDRDDTGPDNGADDPNAGTVSHDPALTCDLDLLAHALVANRRDGPPDQ